MSQKEKIDELTKFFSKASFDYYNIPMAILLCFHKNKFKPLTYNEILSYIVSRKDSSKKLRKSTGEEYTVLDLAIKNLLNSRKKIFKKIINEDKDEDPKYALILDKIQKFWEFSAISMSKLKNQNQSQKNNKNKNIFEEENDNKNNNNESDEEDKLLSRKTRRKNYASDDEDMKENKFSGYSIYHPKGYKGNNIKYKKSSQSVSSNSEEAISEEFTRTKSLNKVDKNGFQSDDLTKSNSNGKSIENNIFKNIYKKSIYDKLPQTDENSLNNIIDKFNKLGQKIKEIQSDLKTLFLSKMFQRYFNENYKKEEKQKLAISNYYDEIISTLEKNKYKPNSFLNQKEFLKKTMNTYLDIYENSYENLFRLLVERSNNLDIVIVQKQENIQKEMIECFNNLNKFIKNDKKKINDSFHYMTMYPRTFYQKRFETMLTKIENRHKENMSKHKANVNMNNDLFLDNPEPKLGKFFTVTKANNGSQEMINAIQPNKKHNNNANKNKSKNNNNTNIINNIFSSSLIECNDFNKDAPPAGSISNKRSMKNMSEIYNYDEDIKNKSLKEDYNDIFSNENNDSNDNCFLSDNSKNDMSNSNSNDANKNEMESNISQATACFYNSGFPPGTENNC